MSRRMLQNNGAAYPNDDAARVAIARLHNPNPRTGLHRSQTDLDLSST
jgi:hypothetical protein